MNKVLIKALTDKTSRNEEALKKVAIASANDKMLVWGPGEKI